MTKHMLTGSLLLLGLWARGQSVEQNVLSSSGDFFSNSQGMIEWTLGEPMSETYGNATNFLTQGFHQTMLDPNSVPEQVIGNLSLFPNPSSDQVTLQFDAESSGVYTVEIYNALGQQLSSRQLNIMPGGYRHEITVRDFTDGIYFVTVRKVGTDASASFRVNKVS
ncbi:MAG: T9SS type A sorting domain-containing protein [Bacteroidetes bacterium]|nr:T9SS type A sorting domain-containing protein [Bacteroidota bacterium]